MRVDIEKLAAEVGSALKKRGLKLATAESCTGGGLGFWITSISGSSDWYERGFITYSNEAKIELLNVKALTLEKQGAVSEKTASEMALGALHASHANIAVAITGIAGPLGGTSDKPVGTVWIGVAVGNKAYARHYLFKGDRHSVREQTIAETLNLILSALNT